MKTRAWISNLIARPCPRPVRKAPHRVRLALEALEDRRVLSILTPLAVPSVIPMEVMGPQGKLVPLLAAGPTGYTPQQLQTAYELNQVSFGGIKGDGAGQTIALVDVGDNPSFVNSTDHNFATSALHIFDETFGLPDPPSFTKVNEQGQAAPLPAPNPSWGAEIAIDVEWSHAMAPAASIILVEANTYSDRYTAAATAGRLATVVSMSWGNAEFSGESSLDSTFKVPGVTFLASTGDHGAPGEYPAYSPHVVAIGGTSLYNLDANGDYPGTGANGEVGWSLGSDSFNPTSAGGGGISQFEPEPSYQNAVQSTGFRTIPDISADADPATGVPIDDPFNYGSANPWAQFGGTSLASPLMAGMVAIADQGRVLSGGQTFSSDQFLADLYSLDQSKPGDFHDIIDGYNGFNAGPGYDEVTGLGTPNGSQLVPDLAYFGLGTRPVLTSIAVIPGNPSIGEGLTEQFTATGTFQAGLTQDITTSVAWASATPAVATINASGLATAQTFGTSLITASLDGVTSPGVTLTSSRLVSLAVAPNDPSVPVLLGVPFTVTGTYSDGSTHDLPGTLVAWASANSAVATIDGTGLATAHALGTSAITASLDGVTSSGDVLTSVAPSFVVNTTVDELYTAGKTSLRQAILEANVYAGHTITFDPTVFKKARTITLTLGELDLTDTTGTETIEGPAAGVTVGGGGRSRVFEVDDLVTASLSGLTITGGDSAGFGGGVANYGTATLTNCTVSGNSAFSGGGLVSSYATTTLTNCTVSGNSASNDGGGVCNLSAGQVTLTNCTVSGNSALNIGGGVANLYSSTAKLTNCAVSGNSAAFGGGVSNFYDSTATLTSCTIRGNSASSYGGGLYNGRSTTATLTKCSVSGNSSGAGGGGVWNAYGATATLTNCTVRGNSAHSGSYYGLNYGGGVFNVNSQVTLTNCTVSGNSAGGLAGGGLANISSPYLFTGTSATATLINCTVSGNSAGDGGGLDTAGYVYFYGGKLSATTTLTNCTVSGNSATGDGGGLDNASLDTTTLTNCTVSGDSANAGGGISDQGTLIVASSTIDNNQATSQGGGISTTGGTVTITGASIALNRVNSSANAVGGGIDCENTILSLSKSTVSGNQATGGAGTAGAPGGDATGGGLYVTSNSTVTVLNTSFLGNLAQGGAGGSGAVGGSGYGGGIAVTGGSSLAFTNSALIGNLALGGAGGSGAAGGNGFGGGCYIVSGATVDVTGSIVTLNFARGGHGKGGGPNGEGIGGGVYSLGTFTVNDATIIVFNLASTSGDNIGP